MSDYRYQHIALSGEAGTGKSSLSKLLIKHLGWNYLNAGDFFRKWHQEHNLPLEDTEKIPEKVDKMIDESFTQKMKEEKTSTIFESRLAGFLAKDNQKVLKILLTTQKDEALRRIANRDSLPLKEAEAKTLKRQKELEKKFQKLYGISDYLNPEFFDLVIDTTHTLPKKVFKKVLQKINA